MAGRTFSDRLVEKGIRAPALPYMGNVPRQRLLWFLAAALVAFGIAFAAGAALVSKPASTAAKLVPSTRSAESRLRILAVKPGLAAPQLKVPAKSRVSPARTQSHPAAKVSVAASPPAARPPAATTPVVRPVTRTPVITPSAPTFHATAPTTPVVRVPTHSSTGTGGSSSSHGRSGSSGTGTSRGGGGAGGTGTSTGGGGSGTGTATGGG
jgi:hypothetical protein